MFEFVLPSLKRTYPLNIDDLKMTLFFFNGPFSWGRGGSLQVRTYIFLDLFIALPRLELPAGLDQQLESQFTNSVIRAGKNDRVRARERTHDKAGVALIMAIFMANQPTPPPEIRPYDQGLLTIGFP